MRERPAPRLGAAVGGGDAVRGAAEEAGQAEAPVAARVRGSRGRGRWVALGVVVVVAAGAAAWQAGAFSSAATSAAAPGAAAPATALVTRQDLSATTPVTATLGYAGSYMVTGRGAGTLTWLPSPGRVIRQGQALYRTGNGSPVALLYGSVPDWRTLGEGVTGQDVSQLNHDLVTLGYADRANVVAFGWDYYSWETAYAVQRVEEHLGVSYPSGALTLGQVVFEPEALRVTQVTGSLGGPASGPVLAATSNRHAVTIPLEVKLTDPRAEGTLDQAPVTVNITTASSGGPVLAVPVTALVAQASGGYQVEVVGRGSTRRWVPVTPGIFDDANGMVQVTGNLTPGERVVVAS